MLQFQNPETLFQSFVARMEQCGWPFTMQDVNRLYRQMPISNTSTLDEMLSLRVTHGRGYHYDTLESGWRWMRDVYRKEGIGTLLRDPRLFNEKCLHRFGSVPYRDELHVEWITINLRAGLGKRPHNARNSASCGFELLTAAALQPDWVMAIDQNTVPTVTAAGIALSGPLRGTVPHLFWNKESDTVSLGVSRDGYLSGSTSSPTMKTLRVA